MWLGSLGEKLVPQTLSGLIQQTDNMASTLWHVVKEEAHDTRTGITTRKRTQQRLQDPTQEERTQKQNLEKIKCFFLRKQRNSEHVTHNKAELRFFFSLSHKLSYVRIIICIIYNIQCERRKIPYPL